MNNNNQKGASLLLTLLIMAALLAIAIGIAQLSLGEIKLVRDIPNSLIAYYAADSGIEWALYEELIGEGVSAKADCSEDLDNESSYGIKLQGSIIKSEGCYKNIRRAIEVSF